MAKAGCKRIGIGLETLNMAEQKEIRKPIKTEKAQQVIRWMLENNIEPLVYLMAGLPQQTYDSIMYTIDTVLGWGGKPRLTAYLNYEKLDDTDPLKLSVYSNMTTSNLENFTENERKHLISFITGSADKDIKWKKKIND